MALHTNSPHQGEPPRPRRERRLKFNFRDLGVLEHAEPNLAVGVCGVVKRRGHCQELIFKKTGSVLFKRDLALAEHSARDEEGQNTIS